MIFKKNRLALAVAVAAGVAMPMSAYATNGYFAHGYSTKTNGLAGAGVALPEDAMAAATNPAGMAFVGNRLDVGAALFSPHREYTASGTSGPQPFPAFNLQNGTYESDNNYFLIPHFGYNTMLTPNDALGVSVYGNGGMNTSWPADKQPNGLGTYYGATVPGGNGTAGVDLMQAFVNGSYARKLAPGTSVGASLIFAYQRFKATGLGAFGAFGFSSDPANLTDNGYDNSSGWGGKIGAMTEVGAGVTLGASYQTKMSMSKLDKYKGLFAEQGGFDIPATWTLGAAWKVTPQNVVTLDVQRIEYSKVKSIANPMLPNLQTAQLGNDNGAGFGWKDMTIYKLGYQFAMAPDWTGRVGYSHGKQPIPESEVLFNILAPAVVQDHITAGFTWNVNPKSDFDVAVAYMPSHSVSGPNPLAAGSQNIELKMYEYQIEASYGYKF
jgi:long-chain fatty acid transport protein